MKSFIWKISNLTVFYRAAWNASAD